MSKKKHSKVTTLNVYQRVNEVRREITAVDKDKQIGEGAYAYMVTTHEAIKAVLRPLMAKHGLVDYIEELEYTREGMKVMRGKTGSQRELIQHQGLYLYRCVNIDDEDNQITFPVRGDGEDTGDKGPGKATTYALKSGQRILFQLGSDESEEERVREEELTQKGLEPISDKQIDQLMKLSDKLFGSDANDVLALMATKLFQVSDITQIPVNRFDFAMKNLKQKAKGEAAAAKKAEKKPKKDKPKPDVVDDDIPPTNEEAKREAEAL